MGIWGFGFRQNQLFVIHYKVNIKMLMYGSSSVILYNIQTDKII